MADTTEFDIDLTDRAPAAGGEASAAARDWLNGVLRTRDPVEVHSRWRPLTGGDLEDLIHGIKVLGGDVVLPLGDAEAVNVTVRTVGFIDSRRVRTTVTGRSYLLAVAKTYELWTEIRAQQALTVW